jgi:RecA-family ATPase
MSAVDYTDSDPNLRERPAFADQALQSWQRTIAQARGDKSGIFRGAAYELMRLAMKEPDANAADIIFADIDDLAILAGVSLDNAEAIKDETRRELEDKPQAYRGAGTVSDNSAELQPLNWLPLSRWHGLPIPQRKWTIHNRVPANQAGLFSGEGGTGKSIIELTKNVAHVTGKDWFGSLPELGPAFYIGAEDDADELHIRLAAITSHYSVTFKEIGDLHVLCLLGQDATLCAATRSGKMETTALYKQIYEAAGDIKPKNISIDTLSRAFAGNEIDRTQVYGFANHMQALAMVAGGSVTVLSHPSLSGIASGSGISGSTAWHGAFRFRQYLTGIKPENGEQPDGDLRQLEFKKNQYGPRAEAIVLRYQNGLFLPEPGMSGLEKVAREAEAEQTFLDLLRRFTGEGRNVSEKQNSPNYAPTAFVKEAEAKKARLRKTELEDALRRLFTATKIEVENYGRPSRPYSRLKIR